MEDVKIFVRSILVSKQHGVKQSLIEKDYHDLVGEKLPWKELGFKTLFDLLTSIPDVAKLEWREDDGDNRVFAVLDGESYASLHAKRMSVKGYGKGSRALNPDEIRMWKIKRGQERSFSDSSASNKSIKKNNNKKKNNIKQSSNQTINGCFQSFQTTIKAKEDPASRPKDVDNAKYGDLQPNMKGLYTLCVKLKYQTGFNELSLEHVKVFLSTHFTEPDCFPVELKAIRPNMAFVRYKTKREAIAMIEKKHDFECGAVSFDVTAAKEKGGQTNTNNLSKSSQKASKNSQSDLENDSTSKAPGLLPLPVIPKEIPLVSFVKPGLLPTPDIGLSLYSCELQKTENLQPVLLIPQQGISDQEKKLQKSSIDEQAINDLMSQLQNEIHKSERAGKPMIFPQQHHVGAARYTFDDFWYRCWVLDCNKERDEIHVFYCDYGNDEIVNGKRFQYINESLWSLQPQAVPVKLPALEPTSESNLTEKDLGRQKFVEICHGKLLAANVVKNANFSESQVIALSNIVVPDLPGVFLEDFLVNTGHLKRVTATLTQRTSVENSVEKQTVDYRTMIDEEEKPRLSENVATEKPSLKRMKEGDERPPFVPNRPSPKDLRSINTQSGKILDQKAALSFKKGTIAEQQEIWPTQEEEDWDSQYSNQSKNGLESSSLRTNTVQVHNDERGKITCPVDNEVSKRNGDGIIHETLNFNGQNTQSHTRLANAASLNNTKKYGSVVDGCATGADTKGYDTNKAMVLTETEIENLKKCPSIYVLKPENTIKAKILEVESPALFYIEKPGSGEIMMKLKTLLSCFEPQERVEPYKGRILCYKDGTSKTRVNVLDLACNFAFSKKVLVIDIDSGEKIWANADDLYLMSPELMQVEQIAVDVGMAGIKTKNQITSLTKDLEKLTNKISFIHIVERDASGKCLLEVYGDDKTKSLNLQAVHSGKAIVTAKPGKRRTGDYKPSGKFAGKYPSVSDSASDSGSRKMMNKPPVMKNEPIARPFSDSSSQDGSSRSSNRRISCSSDSSCNSDISSSASLGNGGSMSNNRSSNSDNNDRSDDSSVFCDVKDTDLVYNQTDYHIVPVRNHTEKEKPIRKFFRPHTPPLSASQQDEKSTLVVAARRKELIHSIKSLTEGCLEREFIRFRPDGSLDRDLIEREMKRWYSEKHCLEKYANTLTETLSTPQDKSEVYINKNRRLRLQIYLQLMSAKEEIVKVTNEVEKLEKERSRYSK
eukprot:gene6078-11461_t